MASLDQQRATFAWERATAGVRARGKNYVNIVKGSTALIMSSGLMQTLSYYKSRHGSNEGEAQLLAKDIQNWLVSSQVLPGTNSEFQNIMDALLLANSAQYMRATQEIMAMLRWLRQFADALKPEQPRQRAERQ